MLWSESNVELNSQDCLKIVTPWKFGLNRDSRRFFEEKNSQRIESIDRKFLNYKVQFNY